MPGLQKTKVAELLLKIRTAEVLRNNLKPIIKFVEIINNNHTNFLNNIEQNTTNIITRGDKQ
jgi:hypothetical protein